MDHKKIEAFERAQPVASPIEQKCVRDRWADALESGRYRQCKLKLRRHDTYCSLGVLIDMLFPGQWEYNSKTGYGMPGIETTEVEKVISKSVQKQVSMLNDAGLTFEQVARFIRSLAPDMQSPAPVTPVGWTVTSSNAAVIKCIKMISP